MLIDKRPPWALLVRVLDAFFHFIFAPMLSDVGITLQKHGVRMRGIICISGSYLIECGSGVWLPLQPLTARLFLLLLQ